MKRKRDKSIREYNQYLDSIDKDKKPDKDKDKCPHGKREEDCTLCISELVNRSMFILC